MDITQALATAANIMLLGMVCVFLFLGLLVIAIQLLRVAVAGEEVIINANLPQPTPNIDDNVKVAISAAVHKYRQNQIND